MSLRGNPFFLLGARRPIREEHLRAYIVREHRAGRRIDEILCDPYVARCGSRSLVERVLADARTVRALGTDSRAAIEAYRLELGL